MMFIDLSMRLPGWSPAILQMPTGFLSPEALQEGTSWTGLGRETTTTGIRSRGQHFPHERDPWTGGETS